MTNAPDSTAFAAVARDLLGPKGFTQDPELVDPWLTDWRGRYTGRACGLASPADTAELSRLVKLCSEHAVPIVPQGGNSGMSGGATPDASGTALLLSLRRMDAIRAVDAEKRQAVCEAGVILQSLHEAAQARDMRFPLTLGGKGSATIGGLISTNAGGTQVLRHGTMRAQVLGLEAVLADGAIFDGLVPLKKDNRGFDLKQLLIGSEGTLGIVTAATLRLLPQIGGRVVAMAGLETIVAARRLLLAFEDRAGIALEGFEVMPEHAMAAVIDHLPQTRRPLAGEHGWYALIELVHEPDPGDSVHALMEEILGEAAEAGLIGDAVVAQNESQAEELWLLRDTIAPAERAVGPAMQHDISVPVESMADFVTEVAPEMERLFPGTQAVAFGHLGDGNIHFHVIAPPGVERGRWEAEQGREISRVVHDRVKQWGGSISAEHGIGQIKPDELERLASPVRLDMMRRIKAAMDPADLLNPGKLVTLASQGEKP